MGRVYRAWDLTRGVPVALKVLSGDARDVARFEREAQISARVDGLAGVVRVHAAGEWEGVHYLVSELVEASDLSAFFALQPSAEEVVRVVISLAGTLQACHDRGVIHRDLKPANVLLGQEGDVPRLIDFGIAKQEGALETLTQTGELLGTPSYMAPEQADSSLGAIGPATDVYGLGAILYAGLCGRPPFVGNTLLVLSNLVSMPPPRLSSIRSGVDRGLEAVCLRALAKRPEDRPTSAAAFAAELQRALDGEAPPGKPWRSLALRLSVLILLALGGGLGYQAWLGARGSELAPTPLSREPGDPLLATRGAPLQGP